jgi:D-alanine-D-alanine ligase
MSMPKTRVLVIFGGRSAEHEVSILSARNVYLALDRERFEPVLVGIDKQGRWRLEPEATLLEAKGDPRDLALRADGPELVVPSRPALPGEARDLFRVDDVVFPILHGTYGEDGTLQGLLELADVAYVGCGPLGAGIGMDKDVAKKLLAHAGVPVVPWHTTTAAAWSADPDAVHAAAEALGFPCFVKPANAGSSVGVRKVDRPEDLAAAVAFALQFDTKVLLEQGIAAREVECAVLGNDAPLATQPGEIVVHHKDGFYSYEAKYVDASGSHPEIPAHAPDDVLARLQALAVRTFAALELSGLARVDFFLEKGSDRVFVNEVNTMPGFTPISMYPKMWEHAGVDNRALVTRLIELAVARRAARRALKTTI